mgnify:CR=1 FL=1
MRLSVSSLTCPDWTLRQLVNEVRRHGIGVIDLRTLEGRNDVWNLPDLAPGARSATRRQLAELGVWVGGVSTSVRAGADPASRASDPPPWARELRAALELCRDLGGAYLRIFAGPRDASSLGADETSAIVSDYRAMCHAAEPFGVSILLETHDVVSSGRAVADIVGEVQHPLAGVVWDVRHPRHHVGESYRDSAEAVATVLRLVHVKDFDPVSFDLLPFGTGDVDAGGLLQVLDYIGYDGDIVLEQPRVAQTGRPMPKRNIAGFATLFSQLRRG